MSSPELQPKKWATRWVESKDLQTKLKRIVRLENFCTLFLVPVGMYFGLIAALGLVGMEVFPSVLSFLGFLVFYRIQPAVNAIFQWVHYEVKIASHAQLYAEAEKQMFDSPRSIREALSQMGIDIDDEDEPPTTVN